MPSLSPGVGRQLAALKQGERPTTGSDEGTSSPAKLLYVELKAGFKLHPDAPADAVTSFPRMGATVFCLVALRFRRMMPNGRMGIPNSSRFHLDGGFFMDAGASG